MRAYSGWFCFVLLLGGVTGFWAGKSEVAAQSLDNRSNRWLAGTVSYGQWQDAFVLFDTQTNRLVAYTLGGSKRLELVAVREITWDLRPVEYGKNEPTVKQMKDLFEESLKEGEGEKKDDRK